MRRLLPLVLSVALVAAPLAAGGAAGASARDAEDTCAAAPARDFSDVGPNNVHRRRIDCIAHHGVTTGTTAETYTPAGDLARGQLASFLVRTLDAGGRSLPEAGTDWFDDDDGSVHEPAINRLAEAGILPTDGPTVGVSTIVDRAEMSRLTVAALDWAGVLDTAPPPDFFVDDEGLPDERAINRLADAGVVSGKGDSAFAPDDTLRRDQMATFLARAVDALFNGPDSHHHCQIRTPERPRFDEWYTQQCDVFGIAVVGSPRVDPAALVAAVDAIIGLVGASPHVHAQMASSDFYLIILGEEENQRDPPEYRHLDEEDYGNTRGVGGYDSSSAGEENILCLESDPYRGESILVHELAHSILDAGVAEVDPTFVDRLRAAYDDAMEDGRWDGTYAATDHHEYWAEGVQSWFDANLEADPPNGIHNHVDTNAELAEHDPALYDLVTEALGSDWRYACP